MKRLSIISAAIGIAIIAAAVYAADPETVAAAIAQAGWAALIVVALRLLAVTLAGLTWWLLFPADARPTRCCRWRRSAATSSPRGS